LAPISLEARHFGRMAPEPNIFVQICTHTQTLTINSDLCPPMPTHVIQIVSVYSKICVMCIYYPPTPSLGWIGQIKGRSLSLASARSASWLAYSLHLRSLTPIWSWMRGCTKPMPTHAHPKPMGMGGHGHGMGRAPNVGLLMAPKCRKPR
jgi:hypothetical protein